MKSRVLSKDDFTYIKELEWWKNGEYHTYPEENKSKLKKKGGN